MYYRKCSHPSFPKALRNSIKTGLIFPVIFFKYFCSGVNFGCALFRKQVCSGPLINLKRIEDPGDKALPLRWCSYVIKDVPYTCAGDSNLMNVIQSPITGVQEVQFVAVTRGGLYESSWSTQNACPQTMTL